MTDVLFPVGRMIGGSVYKAQPELDNLKKPKLNADGTPKTAFNFGVAIPKQGEQHWSQTPWGAQVFGVGAAAHPQHHHSPSYAWKIVDGDSTTPNKAGRIPSEQEGYKGHWIIWFKQSWAPKLCVADGKLPNGQPNIVPLIEADQVIPGYYVQVLASAVGNGASASPGVYLNPTALCRIGFGERLVTASVDVTSVGFGGAPLPAGASATPIGVSAFPQPSNAAPAYPMTAGVAPTYAPTYAPPVAAVPPNPAFLKVPPVPAAPPAPPSGPVMTAKAGGATYAQMVAAGWNDAQLREHGYVA